MCDSLFWHWAHISQICSYQHSEILCEGLKMSTDLPPDIRTAIATYLWNCTENSKTFVGNLTVSVVITHNLWVLFRVWHNLHHELQCWAIWLSVNQQLQQLFFLEQTTIHVLRKSQHSKILYSATELQTPEAHWHVIWGFSLVQPVELHQHFLWDCSIMHCMRRC